MTTFNLDSFLKDNGVGDMDVKPTPTYNNTTSTGFNLNSFLKDNGVSDTEEDDERSELSLDSETPTTGKLKKKDLYRYENLNKIREYMARSKGKNFDKADDEELVEGFMNHMRNWNTNTIGTAGEVMFVTRGSQEDKLAAKNAYDLYDSLGNVFVNDGVYGAVDGVKDYIFSAIKDPTNYLGAATAGIAKLGTFGVSQAGKDLIKKSIQRATMEAARSGATREAAKKAGQEAGDVMARKLTTAGVKGASAEARKAEAARLARQEVILKASQEAKDAFVKNRIKKAGYWTVGSTATLDGAIAAWQTDSIQDIYLDVGAQEKYSTSMTALSAGLGVVGAGFYAIGSSFRGASGLGDAYAEGSVTSRVLQRTSKSIENLKKQLEAVGNKEGTTSKKYLAIKDRIKELQKRNIGDPVLKKEVNAKATKALKKAFDSWADKVEYGRLKGTIVDNELLGRIDIPETLVKNMLIGEDGKGGLVKVLKEEGVSISRKTPVADVITNLIRYMPEEDLQRYSKAMYNETSIHLGDFDRLAVDIGDLLAADASRAGSTLSVWSQVQRAVDAGTIVGTKTLDSALKNKELQDAANKELKDMKKSKPFAYGQSIWKRLLVSSPSTTSANVMGYSLFSAGNSVAELLNGATFYLAGAGTGFGTTKTSRELFRKGNVYLAIQKQKMQNLMDPFTTHDTYMKMLDEHKDLRKLLVDTTGMGVEQSIERFGFDPSNKIVNQIDRWTTAANTITGVRVQDTFTKSQMFMTELDKFLRLKKDTTLQDVLRSGNTKIIDDDVIGGAIDSTLKSVFSKDYTGNDQMLSTAARTVENISNTPGLGFVLPFGRFMNNVVATAYQWSPLSLVGVASNIAKKEGDAISNTQIMSRALTGLAGYKLAYDYSQQQEKDGLAYNEIRTKEGNIIDVRNVYPLSAFLAIGRYASLTMKGEMGGVKEPIEDVLAQLAIGQVARDMQFSNDLLAASDYITRVVSGEGGGSAMQGKEAAGKLLGNITAGATRPLDAINRAVGFIAENDYSKDPRQGRGGQVFLQQSTKYMDNIIEALADQFDAETPKLTGDELRVATREGRLYDANPLSRIFGVTVQRGKTAAEKIYSMAELKTWTADQRSQIPKYDRVFNQMLAPILEVEASQLLKDKRFLEGGAKYRRGRVENVLKEARKIVTTTLNNPKNSSNIERERYRAATKGTKEQKATAMEMMRGQGVDADLRDFTYTELQMYKSYIEYLEMLAEGR